MDRHTDVGDLLRKALVIAVKLQLHDFTAWCKAELYGYTDERTVPSYRLVGGEVKVYNPYNGIWIELTGGSSRVRANCSQSVAEIQDLCHGDGMLMTTAPPALARRVHDPVTPPRIIMQRTSFVGILDIVRNNILDWTLKLEADGILGEGMTFTATEKQTAMSNGPTYNIAGDFHGVIGNVTSQHAQIGSFGQIETKLKEAQVSQAEQGTWGFAGSLTPCFASR